ncbi:hypothetical protein FRC00_005716 [Tulasnella sp. 408]|nr:hypothetical protein FRC00_005716 [Tulasnella sp. 408]
MPLLLGTKRSHAQSSSDAEEEADNSYYSTASLASSSSIPTPATTRHMPSDSFTPATDDRKRKQARYSYPENSPSNLFRVGNDSFYQNIRKTMKARSLPQIGVNTLLELRLRSTKVFRTVQVPSNYTFADLNQVILFIFGYRGVDSEGEAHRWKIVKDVTLSKKNKGEIQACREWVRLSPASVLEEEGEDDAEGEFGQGKAKAALDENDWSLAKVWGSGGVFAQRGVVWTYLVDSIATIDITLEGALKVAEPTKLPQVVEGRGAPRREPTAGVSSRTIKSEKPDSKVFDIESFQENAFELWLKHEVRTLLGPKDVKICASGSKESWRPAPKLPASETFDDDEEDFVKRDDEDDDDFENVQPLHEEDAGEEEEEV